jgi:hypothetical protein
MSNLQYANEKLSDAIYIFIIHEGDARKRIAAALPKLKAVKPTMLPEPLAESYNRVMLHIEKGRSKYLKEFRDETLPHIHKSTAIKLIDEVVRIQDEIERLLLEEDGW